MIPFGREIRLPREFGAARKTQAIYCFFHGMAASR
jgi:hypothetical protein